MSDDPFDDLDPDARRDREGDPFESADGPFQRVDVDSVDPDAVWERFTEDVEPAERPARPLGGEDVPADAPDTVVVPKHRFCETCPHFSTPPEVACTHRGTEILTFVGDEVRVSNCPLVRERRELGEVYD